jgi:hypothetical protein
VCAGGKRYLRIPEGSATSSWLVRTKKGDKVSIASVCPAAIFEKSEPTSEIRVSFENIFGKQDDTQIYGEWKGG